MSNPKPKSVDEDDDRREDGGQRADEERYDKDQERAESAKTVTLNENRKIDEEDEDFKVIEV